MPQSLQKIYIYIFFLKKKKGVLRIYSDLMKNPNGGGTLKKKLKVQYTKLKGFQL
jgi:hypothetical protein